MTESICLQEAGGRQSPDSRTLIGFYTTLFLALNTKTFLQSFSGPQELTYIYVQMNALDFDEARGLKQKNKWFCSFYGNGPQATQTLNFWSISETWASFLMDILECSFTTHILMFNLYHYFDSLKAIIISCFIYYFCHLKQQLLVQIQWGLFN